MTRKSIIKTMFAEQLAAANSQNLVPKSNESRIPAGPVRTMSLNLDKIEEESRLLQEAIASGTHVVDLEPRSIEGSFAADRFAGGDPDSFAALKTSIQENGQEVPILVRPLHGANGRYQVAYGHRRLRAANELGIPVRAVVRPLSDQQLVVAQGLENSARLDLTFIEKAVFARSLEEKGFDRTIIMASLSTDKTELSKLIAAAKGLPEPLVRKIGPARKAGRRRWLQLAELITNEIAMKKVEQIANSPDFAEADTDARFIRVFEAAKVVESQIPREPQKTKQVWETPEGRALVRFTQKGDVFTLAIDEKAEPRFAEFVISELENLLTKFRSQTS